MTADDLLFALDLRGAGAPVQRNAYGLLLPTTGSVVLTWDSPTPTIGHYDSRDAVTALHGQDIRGHVQSHLHHLVDLHSDHDSQVLGSRLLAERLPAMYADACSALEVVDGADAEFVAIDQAMDLTGTDGVGRVAYGQVLPSGVVMLTWMGRWTAITAYPDLDTVAEVHVHGGLAAIVTLTVDRVGHEIARETLAARLPAMRASARAAADLLGVPLPA